MNLPGTTIHKLIDNLTRSPFSFALYRLPWTDEPILILQEEEDVEVLDSLAAVNITAPLFLINTGVALMFGIGASVVASVHLSQGKAKVARINVTQAIIVSSVLLLIYAIGIVSNVERVAALNGKRGFVMTPFHQTKEYPAVLIRPDKVAHEWENISQTLEAFASSIPFDFSSSFHSKENRSTNAQEAKEKYEHVFSRFISSLEDKTFKKLVLSRNYTQTLEGDFSPLTAFIRACNNYPRMMISSSVTSGRLTDFFTNWPKTPGWGRVCPSICPIHAAGRSAEITTNGICW
jgi:hypothetical protein